MKKLFAAAAGVVTLMATDPAAAQIILPSTQQGAAYSATLMLPPTFISATYTSSSLPAGLSISDDWISGVPAAIGTYDFTVNVSGSYMSTCMMPGPFPMPMPCALPTTTIQTYRLQVAPAAMPIPTLSEWAMILLGTLLAGCAVLMIQRQRMA